MVAGKATVSVKVAGWRTMANGPSDGEQAQRQQVEKPKYLRRVVLGKRR